jgi:hypothetical protein
VSTTAAPTAARWLRPYAVAYLWTLTGLLALADATAAVPLARDVAHLLIPLDWRQALHDPNAHDIATALSLWFHNARLALAPLAAGAAVQHRPGRLRQAVDVLLAVVFAVNVIPVGVELGTWGAQLLPYIPNAPAELLALVIGPVSWWLVTRGRLPLRLLWLIAAIVVSLLAVAACLETWMPPQARGSSDPHTRTRMAMVAAPSGAAVRATALTRPPHPRSHHVMSPTTTPRPHRQPAGSPHSAAADAPMSAPGHVPLGIVTAAVRQSRQSGGVAGTDLEHPQ